MVERPTPSRRPSKFQQWREKRRLERLKSGPGPIRRTWDATRRPFIDGTGFEALSYVATAAGTWAATGAPGLKSPEWKSFWFNMSPVILTAAGTAKVASNRQKVRINLQGQQFLQKVLSDSEFARKAEYDLVRRFARNPDGTAKLYKTDPMTLASVYSVLHKRRKSPDGHYNMSRHEESIKFKQVMEPLLRHFSFKTRDFTDNKVFKAIDRHGFRLQKGELKKIRALQRTNPEEAARLTAIPSDILEYLPDRLKSATPANLRQLEDVVMFSAAVARARQDGV